MSGTINPYKRRFNWAATHTDSDFLLRIFDEHDGTNEVELGVILIGEDGNYYFYNDSILLDRNKFEVLLDVDETTPIRRK